MMYKTQTLRSLSVHRSDVNVKSMDNFILLNQDRDISQRHQWKPLTTTGLNLQRATSLNKQISFGGSYSSKKSLLLTLNADKKTQIKNLWGSNQRRIKKQIQTDILLKSKLNFDSPKKQQTQQNQIKSTQKTLDSIQNKQKMEQRLNKFTNSTINFNKSVEQSIVNYKLNSLKNRKYSNTSRNAQSQLHLKITKAYESDQRLIGIITMKQNGLRIRLKHAFAQICICNRFSHLHAHKLENNKNITSLVQQMISISPLSNKHFYYFHLNKEPLTSSSELTTFESVILASQSPILNLDNDVYLSLQEQALKLQNLINSTEKQLGVTSQNVNQQGKLKSIYQSSLSRKLSLLKKQVEDENNESTQYDWQVITDVDQFVEQIVQNPEHSIIHTLPDLMERKSIKNQIRSLYNQKFDTESKIETGEGFRNPLLEDHSHYHHELKQKPVLNAISSKLQQQPFIKNKHLFKRQSIDTLIQKAKQQQQKQQQELQNPNIINRNVIKLHQTKKAVIRQLDQKNTLLFEQNIPYMMEKYGIGRYEIHNLFAIYKTLEKISAMKLHAEKKSKKVLEKGIDRFTFDEGMKRLDINPGQEVIKNICYFSDFISWQQFIKIVSIGLRKTPEQKIEAILSGIGGTNKGQLSKNQISIMIGSSLNKIFDSEQVQLKQYFTEVVMRDLDGDGNGHVDVSEIKKKCLNVAKIKDEEEKMDLVSFLLLNS